MKAPRAVLVDIDHTLSDAFWRDELIGTWDAYHEASSGDLPLLPVIGLINSLHLCRYTIVGITARPEKWRQLTLNWLVRWGAHVHELLMRPDDAFHPSPEIKLELARKRFPDFNDIAFLLEDRDDVCAAFREAGVTVLQVFSKRSGI
jgi:hypothetical protein